MATGVEASFPGISERTEFAEEKTFYLKLKQNCSVRWIEQLSDDYRR